MWSNDRPEEVIREATEATMEMSRDGAASNAHGPVSIITGDHGSHLMPLFHDEVINGLCEESDDSEEGFGEVGRRNRNVTK